MKQTPQSSAAQVIEDLRQRFGETPFLALGQTVLWDEPMKAVWYRLLERHAKGARLIAGVHDTDYFAKTTALIHTDQKYVMLPHDDGATRGLWSAAGEMSVLLGSEDVPTRALYEDKDVPFNWLAARFPGGKAALYSDKTAAWGWRGIVNTEPNPPIAHDVPVKEIAPALLAQIDWAFAESLALLAPEMRAQAQAKCAEIRGWVTDFLAGCSDECTLSDLYQDLLPRLYQLLLSDLPTRLSTTHTLDLLQFNSQTAHLPRFAVVELFLRADMRGAAREAYNEAVAGGGMYSLDAFGPGALPFDLVAPGRGRGTLLITDDEVTIAWTKGEARLRTEKRPETLPELAALIEANYGAECALVGKAVTLIDMLASEFVIVFHETASGYTPRTKALNDRLRAKGVALDLKPIVRLSYPTWDSLSVVGQGAFLLPPHLWLAFGAKDRPVPPAEFAARWKDTVHEQKGRLGFLAALRKPRDIISYLEQADFDDKCWQCHREKYDEAIDILKAGAEKSDILRDQIEHLRAEIAACQAERQRLERESGDDYRDRLRLLQDRLARLPETSDEAPVLRLQIIEENERRVAAFDTRIVAFQLRIRAARREIRVLRAEQRLIERSAEAVAAREQIAQIIYQAELAKMELVRAAFLTSEGLSHTQARPTAWWLPLVDPSGTWFEAIVAGAQARLEDI
ncbi:MAG TPA: hypothetical protein VFW40_12970 [Capsulimonadaceae bacterium]|nr:hypothetical protein [Capsulimonadaceae bacterium]